MTDMRLKCPFTMVVASSAGSGKTTFVKKMLTTKRTLYNKRSGVVYYFYNQWQPLFDEMKESGLVDHFIQGNCDMDWLRGTCPSNPNATIILDDLQLHLSADNAELFSVGARHLNCNVIILCQNLFGKNKYFRDISLNATYVVLFRNPRNSSSVGHFARQFAPNNSKYVVNAFSHATEQPWTYLFIDLHQETPSHLRIRANILGENDAPLRVYTEKNSTI